MNEKWQELCKISFGRTDLGRFCAIEVVQILEKLPMVNETYYS